MTIFTPADHMHRLAKRAMDNGRARSCEEAEAMLRAHKLAVTIDDAVADDPHHQAVLLTIVALARRVFLGGVTVTGRLDRPCATPLPLGPTLGDAIVSLGGEICTPAPGVPQIRVGRGAGAASSGFAIRTAFGGWSAGIVPAAAADPCTERAPVLPIGPMLAAALAVNEAFLHVSGDSRAAGRRAVGLSLWDPSADWTSDAASGVVLRYLPSKLWLIGLGHLGQAYLWALGLLPYADPSALCLILQDDDIITPSTESTSILTDASLVGCRKARAMAAWAERRGFSTTITERLFDDRTSRRFDEPGIALCGVDNAAARRALDKAGFDFVVEAGLGRGHTDFRSLLVHTLPGAKSAAELWPSDASPISRSADAPAYQRLLSDKSLDQCGVTLLAGKAVGAPFVGAVAATVVVSEVLRHLQGGPLHRLVDLNLIDLDYRGVHPQTRDLATVNPGFVRIA